MLSLSVVCAGMDNVRNMTGSPIAGIDPHEFIDSRPLCKGTAPSPVPPLHPLCAVAQIVLHQ